MRILAIRGHNIASLSEPFEIDLTAEPLAGTGLFAITGDTGAGKSTILDVLCLALYGDYPRASTTTREKVADPSGQQLEASDARNILRRGAGQGWAEVDFIGQDGIAYRARWLVRRARGRADGNPQKPERVLQRLDGEGTIAASLKEVEAAVVARTGFTFAQFRRSVLLAQGEFDAFLLASEPERADLLEKITGTEIYSRISQTVYEMTADREWRLSEQERRREAIGALSEEARSVLVAEREAVTQAVAAGEARHAALVAEERRGTAIATVRASIAGAQAALAAAQSAWDDAADERALGARLDAVEPHAPLAARLAELERDHGAAAAAVAGAADASAAAEAAVVAAREIVAEREQAAARAADAIAGAEPLWQRAAELDALVASARSEAGTARQAAEQARAAVDGATKDFARETAGLADVARRLGEAEAALGARAGHATLARDIARVARLVEQHADLLRRAEAERGRWRQVSGQASDLALRLQAADADIEARLRERQSLDDELETHAAALATLDDATLEARFEALSALRATADDACAAARRRDAAIAGAAAARTAIAEAEQAGAASVAALAEARSRQQRLAAERGEAGRMAELAEATLSQHAVRLRATLVDGEACPVCGAPDHPYVHHDAAGAEMARAIRARLAALDGDLTAVDAAVVEARGTIAAAEARAATAARDAAGHDDAVCAARAQLAALLPRLAHRDAALAGDALPAIEDAEPAVGTLTALAGAVEALRAALVEPRRRAAELRRACDDARGRRDAAAKAIAGIERSAKAEREALARLRSEAGAIESVGRELASQSERSREEVQPYLAAAGLTVADVERDPGRAVELMQGLAKDHGALAAAQVSLAAEQVRAAARVASAEAKLATATEAAAIAEREAARRSADLDAVVAARAQLLDGMETGAHRARLRAAETEARRALEKACAALASADAERSRHAAAGAAAEEALRRSGGKVTQATAAWSAALAGLAMADDEARALVAWPSSRRAELAQRLKTLADDRMRAETTLATRKRDLDGELAAGADIDAVRRAEIADELSRLRAALDADKARLAVLVHDLARDDEARAAAAACDRHIAGHRAELAIWQEVNDAIGQRDGAKFRRFAQGVTLGQLVALANEQLAALNPRYRLRTGAVSDLAFDVIDRDMGEEVRSPRSLSGGERFLVSLALALALAGLEGRQSFVDTLFIDEGFGSLDRDTLDVTIDALEALQGQGRKVGVITHVPAMMERIAVQIRVEKRGGGRSVARVRDLADPEPALAS